MSTCQDTDNCVPVLIEENLHSIDLSVCNAKDIEHAIE